MLKLSIVIATFCLGASLSSLASAQCWVPTMNPHAQASVPCGNGGGYAGQRQIIFGQQQQLIRRQQFFVQQRSFTTQSRQEYGRMEPLNQQNTYARFMNWCLGESGHVVGNQCIR